MRILGPVTAAIAIAVAWASASAQSRLLPYGELADNGLTRDWFAQVPVDPARSRVTKWSLHFGRIYAVSDAGLVTAINTETGETLWTTPVGLGRGAAFGPGVNDLYVAVVSASRLYLLDLVDGRVVWQRELASAPAAGPAMSDDYVFITQVTGRVEAVNLHDPQLTPWFYHSDGRIYAGPTRSGDIVTWGTTAGTLYVCDANKPRLLFRLETNDEIVARPAEQAPNLYVGSRDGYLYCVNSRTGVETWRFSAGAKIESRPAVVGDVAYVASFEPALYALDAATGKPLWRTAGLSTFIARGKERVYAADSLGNMYVLEGKSGRVINALAGVDGVQPLVNDQTDRLFLIDGMGLVQCIREVGAETPIRYREPPVRKVVQPLDDAKDKEEKSEAGTLDEAAAEADEQPADEGAEDAAADEPAEEAAPDDAGSPFEAAGEDAGTDDNPFDSPSRAFRGARPFTSGR